MTKVAGTIVLLTGLWLIAFAVYAVVLPTRARTFLTRFATSFHAHLIEMLLRMVVGLAFLVYAERLMFPCIALIFGMVLILASGVLLVLPWRWHQRFAGRVIPVVDRYLAAYAVLSFSLGALVVVGWSVPLFNAL